MKKIFIIISVTFIGITSHIANCQDIPVQLNDFYSVRLKQISESEYTAQKTASKHLRHKPYQVIADISQAQKMLGRRLKLVKVTEGDFSYNATEITFKDGKKQRLDWENEFRAYFPELNVLLFQGGHTSDRPFDLSDSANERNGNPYYHAVSPDKQLRINGIDPGQEGIIYWLEKWNKSKKKYEFIGYFSDDNSIFYYSKDWFWTSNSKAFFKHGWDDYALYYEVDICLDCAND